MTSILEDKAFNLTPQSIISAHPEQLSSDLDGETILLQMSSGLYYGLNEMGAAIWEMIQTPQSFAAIQAQLLEQYEVSAEVCEQAIVALFSELYEAKLIDIKTQAD
jgi:hypothetical protein